MEGKRRGDLMNFRLWNRVRVWVMSVDISFPPSL